MTASNDLRTLETTADADLALRLAEARTPGLDAVLVKLIRRPDLAGQRQALVHALGHLDCSDHVGLLVELATTADAKVAHEALQALETIEEADGEDLEAALALLAKAQAQTDLPAWRRDLLDDLAEILEA